MFKVGDVVELNGGSRKLTIEEVLEGGYRVMWWWHGAIHRGAIAAGVVQLVEFDELSDAQVIGLMERSIARLKGERKREEKKG